MSKKDVLSADVWAEALISNKEIYILDKIFKNEIPSKFSDKIKLAVIDSFAQFSQTPPLSQLVMALRKTILSSKIISEKGIN